MLWGIDYLWNWKKEKGSGYFSFTKKIAHTLPFF